MDFRFLLTYKYTNKIINTKATYYISQKKINTEE
jgi:hypothetical protein